MGAHECGGPLSSVLTGKPVLALRMQFCQICKGPGEGEASRRATFRTSSVAALCVRKCARGTMKHQQVGAGECKKISQPARL